MPFDPSTQYLNIWNFLQYELIGSSWLMLALGIIIIAYFSARSAMPFQGGIIFIILYFLVFSAITESIAVWTVGVLAVGLIFYWMVSRALRRN